MTKRGELEDRGSVDAVSRQVLGIAAFLDRKRPRGEAAIEEWSGLANRGFPDAGERSRELERLRKLDNTVGDATIDALDHDLSSLPTMDRVFRRLDADELLRDADFFELKRFLYHALSVLEAAAGLDNLPGGESATAALLRVMMETIHPENSPSARFHLADELDPKLQERRAELRTLRRQVKERRRELETEIRADYAGKFDVHGRFRATDSDPIDDARLRWEEGFYRLVDDQLASLKERHESLVEKVTIIEGKQRRRLTRFVEKFRQELSDLKSRLVGFDLRLARVELRRDLHGCWPKFVGDGDTWLNITGGREPALLEETGPDDVQPIDVRLSAPATVVLGPNMGGKSALLRLVGLMQWCAQMAMPVPAGRCEFRDVHRIIYIGSEEPGRQSATEGLSSFGREVRRFVQYWEEEGPMLWLLDEPGRGTHPEEGARLAGRIARERIDRGDIVVMATHFPGLAETEDFARLRIAGLIADDTELEEAIRRAGGDSESLQTVLRQFMDYRVVEDPDGEVPRDAWRVARALGLDLQG